MYVLNSLVTNARSSDSSSPNLMSGIMPPKLFFTKVRPLKMRQKVLNVREEMNGVHSV